jgi:hypothetical protein
LGLRMKVRPIAMMVATSIPLLTTGNCEDHCLSVREGHRQVQRIQIIRSFR